MDLKPLTKTITIQINVPADYQFIARNMFGDMILMKKKPQSQRDQSADPGVKIWKLQETELNILSEEMLEYNQIPAITCGPIPADLVKLCRDLLFEIGGQEEQLSTGAVKVLRQISSAVKTKS